MISKPDWLMATRQDDPTLGHVAGPFIRRPDTEWIQTFTGKRFWPLDPIVEDIDIRDIAHHLSMICRFTGAVREFYSVAQHSVYVSLSVPPKDAFEGLLHDGSEAYLTDLARPVKHSEALAGYRAKEKNLECAVAQRFCLSDDMPDSVREADQRMLYTERRDLLGRLDQGHWSDKTIGGVAEPYEWTIFPWRPERAEREFLNRYYTLTRGRTDG